MNEITIQITLDEYRDLVKKAEIIETVMRYLRRSEYPTIADVKIILDVVENGGEGNSKL